MSHAGGVNVSTKELFNFIASNTGQLLDKILSGKPFLSSLVEKNCV